MWPGPESVNTSRMEKHKQASVQKHMHLAAREATRKTNRSMPQGLPSRQKSRGQRETDTKRDYTMTGSSRSPGICRRQTLRSKASQHERNQIQQLRCSTTAVLYNIHEEFEEAPTRGRRARRRQSHYMTGIPWPAALKPLEGPTERRASTMSAQTCKIHCSQRCNMIEECHQTAITMAEPHHERKHRVAEAEKIMHLHGQ